MSRVCVLAALGLSLAAVSAAAAAERPRVGYVGSDARTLSAEATAAVDAGAVAGLEATTTVQAVPISRTDVSRMKSGRLCASEECAKAVGERTRAEYLLRADVKRTGQADYAITLDLIRVAPFGVLFTSDDQCAGCVPAKLGRRVELGVSALVTKLVESLETKPLITDKSGTAAAPTGELKSALAPRPARIPAEASARRWAWVPWTAGGLAVASLVGGVIAWRADGDGSCSLAPMERQCPRAYQTKPLAIGLGAVGLVSAAGAMWSYFKLRDGSGHDIALGTAGTNLIVTGRF